MHVMCFPARKTSHRKFSRDVRDDTRNFLEKLVPIIVRPTNLITNAFLLLQRKLVWALRKLRYVQTVRHVGGNSSRGSVGLRKISLLFQNHHFLPNHGGTDAEVKPLGKVFGSLRLGIFSVEPYDRF